MSKRKHEQSRRYYEYLLSKYTKRPNKDMSRNMKREIRFCMDMVSLHTQMLDS